jgi:hypothetical protein
MSAKHHAQHKDLIFSLADRVQQRADEHVQRCGVQADIDRALLARARLAGWKPVTERRTVAR